MSSPARTEAGPPNSCFRWVVAGLALVAFGASAAERLRFEPLFDGQTLAGWVKSGFEGEGDVKVVNPFREGRAAIVIEKGTTLSGITSTRRTELPRMNYELSFEAMRLGGLDFFCALTFPVDRSACTLVVGGWGGSVLGLSSIDRQDASQNETSQQMEFDDDRWYRIRVRVTAERIEVWIDDQKKIDVATKGRNIGMRPGEIEKSRPLGFATYMTRAAFRQIQLESR